MYFKHSINNRRTNKKKSPKIIPPPFLKSVKKQRLKVKCFYRFLLLVSETFASSQHFRMQMSELAYKRYGSRLADIFLSRCLITINVMTHLTSNRFVITTLFYIEMVVISRHCGLLSLVMGMWCDIINLSIFFIDTKTDLNKKLMRFLLLILMSFFRMNKLLTHFNKL